jgi:hypothetical protein
MEGMETAPKRHLEPFCRKLAVMVTRIGFKIIRVQSERREELGFE